MNEIIRFVIKMRQGNYMKQEFDPKSHRIVNIWTVDNPIDADLLKDRFTAERVIQEVLSGNTNLMTIYDENNPPEKVVELKIKFESL